MGVRAIPGALVERYFDTVRIPVQVAEGVAERVGVERFVPTIAFDAITGSVTERIGGVLGDADLAERGRRTRVAADERARAIRLAAEAEAVTIEAQERFESKVEQAEKLEDRVERKAEAREKAIETQHEAKVRKANEQKARKKAAVKRVADAQEQRIERKERDERLAQLELEEKALAESEVALTTESEALRLEDAATKVKAARKAK